MHFSSIPSFIVIIPLVLVWITHIFAWALSNLVFWCSTLRWTGWWKEGHWIILSSCNGWSDTVIQLVEAVIKSNFLPSLYSNYCFLSSTILFMCHTYDVLYLNKSYDNYVWYLLCLSSWLRSYMILLALVDDANTLNVIFGLATNFLMFNIHDISKGQKAQKCNQLATFCFVV